ncbi:hypothetical protein [Halorussus pelagicus]|uniref:hypothetical protein n=1 Tax=Halorussus pelagicus TaxID=2505977 RepID=UPI000FFB9C2B|nr:hypothetical protein [Halorussus pelagicus]
MIDTSQLPVVVGLAVLGVGLAGLGTAIGVPSPTADGPASEFAFEGQNLTYSDGETEVEIVNGTSRVETVEFEYTTDGVEVAVDEQRPLSESERNRAREIALENETVRQRLDDLGDGEYVTTVDPVRKVSATASVSVNDATPANETVKTDGNVTAFTVSYDEKSDAVVADRVEPSYVPDEASVQFEYPDGRSLSVVVDIDSETVKHVFA